MHHDTDLINIVAGGLAVAFVLGALANRLRMSPLVGYLIAGIIVGPFTPGSTGGIRGEQRTWAYIGTRMKAGRSRHRARAREWSPQRRT